MLHGITQRVSCLFYLGVEPPPGLTSISGTPHPQDRHLVDLLHRKPLPVQGDPQKGLGRYYLATASELKLIDMFSVSGSQVTEHMVMERNGHL